MKLYTVRPGTRGFVVDTEAVKGNTRAWTTTKKCEFSDTVIDPIRFHNQPTAVKEPHLIALAMEGYAVFADYDNPRWLLAVKYDECEILC